MTTFSCATGRRIPPASRAHCAGRAAVRSCGEALTAAVFRGDAAAPAEGALGRPTPGGEVGKLPAGRPLNSRRCDDPRVGGRSGGVSRRRRAIHFYAAIVCGLHVAAGLVLAAAGGLLATT